MNIAAHDDYVAHDGSIKDDFKEMWRGHDPRIAGDDVEDVPRIYTFWVGNGACNPHKLYGYLNHPTVAARLAQWINA